MKPETSSQANRTAAEEREEARRVKLPRHLKERRSDLRWFWNLGLILLKIRPPAIYRLRWVREELPTMNVPPDLGSKAMAFAASFTRKELRELKKLGRSWSEIVTVLPFETSAERMQLLTEAKENEWSIRELRLQVAKKRPVPRVQDRKEVSPVSCGPQRDLYRLAKITSRWRLNTSIWKEAVSRLPSDPDLPREGDKFQILIEVVEKAGKQLRGLRQDAAELNKALTALRRELEPRPGRNR